MKTLFLFLFTICTTILMAQSVPYLFNYQAVARDLNGQPLTNQSLSVKFSIASAPGGTAIWTQNFDNISTNEFGLFSLSVGDTKLRNIPWKNGSFYLNAEITSNGSATSPAPAQLLSVPYALVADTVLHAPASGGNQTLSISGTTLSISNGNSVNLPTGGGNQTLSISGTTLSISNGNSVTLPATGGGNYLAGTGIKIDNTNKIISLDTATAGFPRSLPPNGNAAGDLSGTYPAPSVIALRGKNITAAPPTTGQVLKFDGTNWGPGADNTGPAGSRTNYTGDNIIKVDTINYKISLFPGTAAGQVVKWNGSAWTADTIKVSAAKTNYAGDNIIKVDTGNYKISFALLTNGANGAYYAWDSVNKAWILKTPAAATGTTGGWSLTGNAGTSATTNFIGTTDNTPLIFKVNGAPAGRIEPTATANTAFGYKTLNVNAGIQNTAIGDSALAVNTSGNYNTATGYRALSLNQSGKYNTAVGDSTLLANTSGILNTAIGAVALASNTTGTLNEATGVNALRNNQTGSSNTANGADALFFNNDGGSNTAVGNAAMFLNVNGSNNTAVGVTAAYSIKGSNTTAVGSGALKNNTADNATAVGSGSMFNNMGGIGNTAVGFNSLYKNIGGNQNTAVGEQALFTNASGANNTAVGYLALNATSASDHNTAVGSFALNQNTAIGNTAIGSGALFHNSTGTQNAAVGINAMTYNTTGSFNVAMGISALSGGNGNGTSQSGNSNVAVGQSALFSCQTGSENTAIGGASMIGLTTGTGNTAVGYNALRNDMTSKYNTAIGYNANLGSGTLSYDYTIAIGYSARVTASNQARIGDASINSIGGFANWTNISDGRFKENISEDVPGLRFISKLRPVTYRLNRKKINDFLHASASNNAGSLKKNFAPALDAPNFETLSDVTTGFVAQEVEQAAQAVGFDFSGVDKPKNSNDYYGLRYAEFTVPLVKAVQEQQTMIEKQQTMIEKLQMLVADLQKQVQELKK